MSEKLLLEIIVILLGCLLGGVGWAFKHHDHQHEDMKKELEDVKRQRLECGTAFATKGAMERAHTRIDEIEAQTNGLSSRVIRLEAGSCHPGDHHDA